ncbi:hypothetical protein TrRE_jg12133, partial [Triparma retinervis]
SYAFLEVFFDHGGGGGDEDAAATSDSAQDLAGGQAKGQGSGRNSMEPPARERTSEGDVGLTIDGDDQEGNKGEAGERKRKNVQISISDDDLAARGLISVSKSNENLSHLALPIKMQKSLSQEFTLNIGGIRKRPSATAASGWTTHYSPYPANTSMTDPSGAGVPAPTSGSAVAVCAISGGREVDTQLRPCGCMFMGAALKKRWAEAKGGDEGGEGKGQENQRGILGAKGGVMMCPNCGVKVESAVLAVEEQQGDEGEEPPSF